MHYTLTYDIISKDLLNCDTAKLIKRDVKQYKVMYTKYEWKKIKILKRKYD